MTEKDGWEYWYYISPIGDLHDVSHNIFATSTSFFMGFFFSLDKCQDGAGAEIQWYFSSGEPPLLCRFWNSPEKPL